MYCGEGNYMQHKSVKVLNTIIYSISEIQVVQIAYCLESYTAKDTNSYMLVLPLVGLPTTVALGTTVAWGYMNAVPTTFVGGST